MEKVTEVAAEVKEKVETVAESASQKLDEMGVTDKVADFVETAKEKTAEAAGWVEEKAHDLKESLENVADKVDDKVEDLKNSNEEKPAE
jgi:cell division protein ZapA (FtsZ GTPase activity inhibitor)